MAVMFVSRVAVCLECVVDGLFVVSMLCVCVVVFMFVSVCVVFGLSRCPIKLMLCCICL